jgi:hypothetical protein
MKIKITRDHCCENCKKWRTPRCDDRKYCGRDSGPEDWCAGYKEKSHDHKRDQ